MGAIARKADAFLFPRGFSMGKTAAAQHHEINAAFAPLAGAQRLWFSVCDNVVFAFPNSGQRNYVADTTGQSILYPSGHPLAGQDRYQWFVAERDELGRWYPAGYCESAFDMPGFPKIGYLLKDETEGDPQVVASISEIRESATERARNMMKQIMNTPEHYQTLRDRLGLSDAEMEAQFGHVDKGSP